MFLSRGEVAYFGPSNQVLGALKDLDYACPNNDNPADFTIDVIVAAEYESTGEERQELIDMNAARFAEEDVVVDGPDVQQPSTRDPQHASFLTQYHLLLKRELLNLRRNPLVVFAQLLQAILVGLMVGLLYFDLTLDQTGRTNRISILYILLMDRVFILAGGSMAMFAQVCACQFLGSHRSEHYGLLHCWFSVHSASKLDFGQKRSIFFDVLALFHFLNCQVCVRCLYF